MKTYDFEFVSAEYEEFKVPEKALNFKIIAYDMRDALRKADNQLYNWGVTGHLDDFFDDDYSLDGASCILTYGDAERGLSLNYKVHERNCYCYD